MKRSLSLILALVMVLGSFTGVFAAPQTADEAGAFLQSVGVLLGDDEGNLNLGSTLERRDTVVLLSRLMGQEEVASTFPTSDELPTWGDVRTDAYYLPFLAWAQTNGYFEGNDEGMFNPRAAITAQEYALVLLRALGYEVSGHDAWVNAIETATEKGLLEGVEVTAEGAVLRGQMAVMTVNTLEATMANSETTLAESLGITMPVAPVVDATKVEKVYAENLKEVVVVFDGEVDKTTAELEFNYNLDDSALNITKAVLSEDMTTVTLTIEHEKNDVQMENQEEYELTVSGVKAGDVLLATQDIEFTALDNSLPTVVEVRALGTRAIRVEMSEPVRNVNNRNFELNGRSYFGSLDVNGRVIILRPNTAMSTGSNELTVKNVEDFAEFKSLTNTVGFEVVEDTAAPVVVETKATLNEVELIFDEEVDPNTVRRTNFYWEDGSTKRYPDTGENGVKVSGNKVTLKFDTYELPAVATTLHLINVADYSGNRMPATEVVINPVIDQTRPEVVFVRVHSDNDNQIVVRFNKSMDRNSAESRSNYELKDEDGDRIAVRSISYNTDRREVTITLIDSSLPKGLNTLRISGVRDNTTLKNVMIPQTFELDTEDNDRPGIDRVTKSSDNRVIEVIFDKEMNLSTTQERTNYLLVKDNANGTRLTLPSSTRIFSIQNGEGVRIELPEKIGTEVVKDMNLFGIIVLGVEAENGESLKANEVGTVRAFGVESVEPVNFSSSKQYKAELTDETTLKINFNRSIVSVSNDVYDEDQILVPGYEVIDIVADGTSVVVVTLEEKEAAEVNTGITTVEIKGSVLKTTLETFAEEVTLSGSEIKDKVAPRIKMDDTVTADVDTVTVNSVVYDEIEIVFTENVRVFGSAERAFEIEADGDTLNSDEFTVIFTQNTDTMTIRFAPGNKAEGAYQVRLLDGQRIIEDSDRNFAEDSRVFTFEK